VNSADEFTELPGCSCVASPEIRRSYCAASLPAPNFNTMSSDILARVEAGKAAVMAQTDLFHREFGRAQSSWKSDGTRVTPVDVAISENIVRILQALFPQDEFFSEELAETPEPTPLRARFHSACSKTGCRSTASFTI
jgi:hypothetical protein